MSAYSTHGENPLLPEVRKLRNERDSLQARLDAALRDVASFSPFTRRAADALANEVDVLVRTRVIDSRSPAADALLDYRDPSKTDAPGAIIRERARAQAAEAALVAAQEEVVVQHDFTRHYMERSDNLALERKVLRSELDAAEAEVARLRATLAELGPRQCGFDALGWACDAGKVIEGVATGPCTCGAEAHNAKVAAALAVKHG